MNEEGSTPAGWTRKRQPVREHAEICTNLPSDSPTIPKGMDNDNAIDLVNQTVGRQSSVARALCHFEPSKILVAPPPITPRPTPGSSTTALMQQEATKARRTPLISQRNAFATGPFPTLPIMRSMGAGRRSELLYLPGREVALPWGCRFAERIPPPSRQEGR